MSSRAFHRLPALAIVAAHLAGGSVAELHADQFVGAAGCKSSSCHGGAGEKRSQYLTWVQQDFHARAYAVLINARSARMAETLALPAAQMSERCTICHSPFQSVAPAHLTTTANVDEGVSCESCHGAAGSWLRGHTRKDWNYATRVTAGMRDLRNFYVRANTCVACHQNVEAELLKAGHPKLTFELDGQSIAEPEHWKDDDLASGPRAWLVGQAVALREMSWTLSKTDAPDTGATARWRGLVWLLAKVTANQSRLPVITPPGETVSRAMFVRLQEQSDSLARHAAVDQGNDDFAARTLQRLASANSEFFVSYETPPDLLFRRAQRLVLALDRLSRAVDHQPAGPPKNPQLARLFEDLRSRTDFEAAHFREHLASFCATIAQAPH